MHSKSRTISATPFAAAPFAAALLGCTVLAGLPVAALAQDGGAGEGQSQTQPAQRQGNIVQAIGVRGAQRLEPETIVSYIKIRPGDVYTPAAADQALVDLADTGLFADYAISFENGQVTIDITENPVINRIVLEGNKRLDDDKIRPEIKLSPRQIFTRSKVRADVARIIELYKRQGRFAASVEPQMVLLDQNRVDVIFEINEGPKSKVRQINIIGNEKFSDGKLRGQMITKEAGITKILSSNTSYDPDRLAFDQQKLRQFYLTEGYADFRVVSAVAELTPDKRDFIITYVVEEGERYKFGDVKVDSQLRDFSSERLTEGLAMKTGDWYNAQQVDSTIEGLTETAGAFGYAFADVRPRIVPNRENLTMDVTFTVANAPRVYIESVDINGNVITQDKVIRREFRIAEGDAFSSLQVERTNARINSLGYFQDGFEIEQVEGSSPDRVRLVANVQEEPTGELSLSAGFSSLESFIFNGSVRQNNFRGRGQTLGLGVNYSRYSRSGNISFSEPKVFDRDIAAGVDIYRQDYRNGYTRDSSSYQQATTGFGLRTGVPLTEYMSALARYTFNYVDVSVDEERFLVDFDGDGVRECDPIFAGQYICDAIGKRTQSILGLSVNYNSLNSRLRPTKGRTGSVSLDFAGLGGNTRYVRGRANAAQYVPLGSGFIGSLSLEGGYIHAWGDNGTRGGQVRLTDRFFLGESQMRGFDIRGLGPRLVQQAVISDDGMGNLEFAPIGDDRNRDDALGGTAYYLARAEVEIPLGAGALELGLRPSVFLDVGSVFGVNAPFISDNRAEDTLAGFIAERNENDQPLYTQIDSADFNADMTACDLSTIVTSTVTDEANGAAPACVLLTNPDGLNAPRGISLGGRRFREVFLGNSAKPRVSIGFGVNWNSPFGPFRIDISKVLLKQEGDETKTISFNVGTQF